MLIFKGLKSLHWNVITRLPDQELKFQKFSQNCETWWIDQQQYVDSCFLFFKIFGSRFDPDQGQNHEVPTICLKNSVYPSNDNKKCF
jgi:hypothetical protein